MLEELFILRTIPERGNLIQLISKRRLRRNFILIESQVSFEDLVSQQVTIIFDIHHNIASKQSKSYDS